MKVIELEKNKTRINMYFDADTWDKLHTIAQDMTSEAGRRITVSALVRLAVKQFIKSLG